MFKQFICISIFISTICIASASELEKDSDKVSEETMELAANFKKQVDVLKGVSSALTSVNLAMDKEACLLAAGFCDSMYLALGLVFSHYATIQINNLENNPIKSEHFNKSCDVLISISKEYAMSLTKLNAISQNKGVNEVVPQNGASGLLKL